MSKLASVDMHALDAYYHPSCLTALYNRVRNIRSSKEQGDSESSQVALEAIALAELVMYIEEVPRPMVFQLSDLAKMYSCLLEQLGGHVPCRVNSTRLKDRLLAQIPELGAYTEGKEEMGNPFCKDSADLVLDSEEIVPKCVVEAVSEAKIKGQSMYDNYVEERLLK